MSQTVKLLASPLQVIRTVNDKLMSYNVEFTEVTGGTFWKEYTPEQIAGTEPFRVEGTDIMSAMASLMQVYPPIDLYSEKLRKLASKFGPVWVRVSGTWATKTYYDFEGTGVTPEGYQNRLTKEQWIGVLDFAKAIGAKLLISVANCEGLHKASEPWNPSQAEKIFALSKEHGVPIDAVEFTNEPNMLDMTGFPPGYTAADFARDQDIFYKWVRENYPGTLIVGPCSTEGTLGGNEDGDGDTDGSAGIAGLSGNIATTDELMEGVTEPLDVYSYHYYNGISDRLAMIMPDMHWAPDKVLSEEYLAVAPSSAKGNAPKRDKYCPGGEMWVTESGDAGGGGDTWASTYADVFRTLNELGTFATITDGIIFHNTLASSDYGFLKHGTFEPRPNYFAVLLWNRIMGTTVYDTEEEIREGAHVFAHSRKDGKDGVAYLVINNSQSEATTIELPKSAEVYKLTADTLRATTMRLNGRELVLGANNELPDMSPVVMDGILTLEPATMAFVVM